MKKKKKGSFLMTIGLLLIVAALALTGYNFWDDKRAGDEADFILEELKAEIEANIRENAEAAGGTVLLPEYYEDSVGLKEYDEMPTGEIYGYSYIGMIEIPALNISLPVMSEWSYPRLRKAPCRYTGSYLTDDMVICGHNYNRHFGPVRWIELGTEVNFINVDGQVYKYYVYSVERITPDNGADITTPDGSWDLTLFTCTTDLQARCTVRCKKIE